jgi:hypothetical protein
MNKLGFFIKKNSTLIIISIILVALSIYHKIWFFVVLLFYGLFIKFLMSKYNEGKVRKIILIVIWSSFIIIFCLGFYVNHYLPHGPRYPTGDYECLYGDRGGNCGEVYAEDMRKLNIPDWAKFLRGSEGLALLLGLLVAGIFASEKKRE